MDNKNSSAFPYYSEDEKRDIPGLTKREYFAAKAMQGLMAVNNKGLTNWEDASREAAKIAVDVADKLMAQLEKTQP